MNERTVLAREPGLSNGEATAWQQGNAFHGAGGEQCWRRGWLGDRVAGRMLGAGRLGACAACVRAAAVRCERGTWGGRWAARQARRLCEGRLCGAPTWLFICSSTSPAAGRKREVAGAERRPSGTACGYQTGSAPLASLPSPCVHLGRRGASTPPLRPRPTHPPDTCELSPPASSPPPSPSLRPDSTRSEPPSPSPSPPSSSSIASPTPASATPSPSPPSAPAADGTGSAAFTFAPSTRPLASGAPPMPPPAAAACSGAGGRCAGGEGSRQLAAPLAARACCCCCGGGGECGVSSKKVVARRYSCCGLRSGHSPSSSGRPCSALRLKARKVAACGAAGRAWGWEMSCGVQDEARAVDVAQYSRCL
jgi:hypothetical protein